MKYDRCKKIFGDKFEHLQNAKVIILGVGGVGGYALDCLYRSGITNITIVDYDCFEETNQNRQIGSDAIGVSKVEHLKTLYPKIIAIEAKIDLEWIENNDLNEYDLILDAIDDIKPKVQIIKRYYKKLVSTTGSAKRLDPTKIEYINIWKTHNDPFAKKIREELKKIRFNKNFKVIFSSELPQCKDLGSFVGVTGSFGLAMCSKAMDKLSQ
ncbi:MAG: tRNA threonylcarbamoyladenosine dehydratase [Campylobacteraceae bacterium]|jgi:tRNA A37 threonylcarbamoyladenosine dehydratase|nr:tRNA threonylcarbamoyladenosine dehydratase [Campylobacteraceae bacterium]MBT3882715.1 tRNA threonylcarbamoyladenosine dehydratase [Campylobacteraceae bacterium]MBT4030520.1 tRNA threonylcarbamoyladenosine dehydratase [Campylobacteraceae bacterium]MBT4179821.1 tRNA threonylcarbamoyladenosine dehydratase [Campylobacteraceae bacterium]MBT4573179.1 tRNA threonylcarbamoyladenosine dehydratase [Campylobacteraceae bacterium]